MKALSFKSLKLVPDMAVAVALFCSSLVAGLLLKSDYTELLMGDFSQLAEQLSGFGAGGLLVIIFLNNALKALAAVIFGLFLGLPSALFLVFNGFILGIIAATLSADYGQAFVLSALIPHGIIEIPAVIFATSLGLRIGRESFSWLTRRQSTIKAVLSNALYYYVYLVLPSLAISSVIEVFITPIVISSFTFKP